MNDATTNAAPVGFDAIERVAQQIQSGLFVLLAVLGVVGVIAVVVKQKAPCAKDRQYRYVRQTSLFTRAERMFSHTLELAVSDRFRIFAMVRVADVLTPERSLARKAWQGAFNRISAKHLLGPLSPVPHQLTV